MYEHTYLQEKQSHYKWTSLAIPNLLVIHGVRLQHIQETLLTQPISLLEEGMLRKCPVEVTLDGTLVRGRLLQLKT